MLTGSPGLCRPLLTRMDTHQSLIIRQRWKSAEKTDEVTGYYFTLRNVIEEFRWIESDKLSNKFLFVHIFWLSQVIHKKTRMWCYCQLTILLWRSQQSMYHCGARCKDICLVSCRRRQKNWGIYVFVQFSLNPSNRSGLQMENLRVCLSVCHHFRILNIGP